MLVNVTSVGRTLKDDGSDSSGSEGNDSNSDSELEEPCLSPELCMIFLL